MTAHPHPAAFAVLPPLTRIAFDARLSQLTCKGYSECEFEAYTACGSVLCFSGFFDCELWDHLNNGPTSERDDHVWYVCKLVGAWAEDGDTGALFAGNRDEIAAMVGADEVARWEKRMADGMNE